MKVFMAKVLYAFSWVVLARRIGGKDIVVAPCGTTTTRETRCHPGGTDEKRWGCGCWEFNIPTAVSLGSRRCQGKERGRTVFPCKPDVVRPIIVADGQTGVIRNGTTGEIVGELVIRLGGPCPGCGSYDTIGGPDGFVGCVSCGYSV